jgi:hypothetical protein
MEGKRTVAKRPIAAKSRRRSVITANRYFSGPYAANRKRVLDQRRGPTTAAAFPVTP